MKIDIDEEQKIESSTSDCGNMMSISEKPKLNLRKDYYSEKDMKEDRLSSLPDCILVEILSHLPIKDAVATSIVSRPWRNLWTHINRLRLDILNFKTIDNFSEKFLDYYNCVDLILGQNTKRSIHSFYLKFPCACFLYSKPRRNIYIPVCPSKLNSWFQKVCERDVVEIIVSWTSMASSLNIPPVPLPMCVFQSKTLATLLLSEHVRYKFPEDGVIGFPYLKKLSIGIHDRDLQVIRPLLKSIPALEDLNLFINLGHRDLEKVEDVEISAPVLKSLTIRCVHFPQQNKIVIDSPKLEYLKIVGVSVRYDFVENPTELRTAVISGRYESIRSDSEKLGRIVSCISSTRALHINTRAFIPVFSNSTHGIDGVVVTAMFHNLVHLSIEGSYKGDENWSDLLPTWVISVLKRVDVDFRAENDDYNEAINLVRYVLSNANVLEQLIVYGRYGQGIDGEEAFFRKLCSLSPISSNCEIEFRGYMIRGKR